MEYFNKTTLIGNTLWASINVLRDLDNKTTLEFTYKLDDKIIFCQDFGSTFAIQEIKLDKARISPGDRVEWNNKDTRFFNKNGFFLPDTKISPYNLGIVLEVNKETGMLTILVDMYYSNGQPRRYSSDYFTKNDIHLSTVTMVNPAEVNIDEYNKSKTIR